MYFRTGEQNTHAENSSGNIGQFKHEPAEIDVHRVRSLFIRVGSRRFLFLSILLSSNFKGVRILLPSRLSPTEPVVMDSWFCSHGKFTYGQLGTGPTHTCCKFRLVRKYADGRCIIIRITHICIHCRLKPHQMNQ